MYPGQDNPSGQDPLFQDKNASLGQESHQGQDVNLGQKSP